MSISRVCHLSTITPFLISTTPGLARTIVFSVIGSVPQKGYEAPVSDTNQSIIDSSDPVKA